MLFYKIKLKYYKLEYSGYPQFVLYILGTIKKNQTQTKTLIFFFMITCDICKKIHSKGYKIKSQTYFKIYIKQLPSEEKFDVKTTVHHKQSP